MNPNFGGPFPKCNHVTDCFLYLGKFLPLRISYEFIHMSLSEILHANTQTHKKAIAPTTSVRLLADFEFSAGWLLLIYSFQFRSAFQPQCRNWFSNFTFTC